jgi:hypothetical protein
MLVFGLVAATSVSAHALDLCMDLNSGEGWVLKNFKAPRKRKCAPMQGFENTLFYAAAMSGMGCTNIEGDHMTLHYSSHNVSYPSYQENVTCHVDLPIPAAGTSWAECVGTYLLTPPGDKAVRIKEVAHVRYCNVDHLGY